MTRGRKPKCFGHFTDDDAVWKRWSVDPTTIDVGYSDASFYCITECPHSIDCATESEKTLQEHEL